MIETVALFLLVLFSFGFAFMVNRNLITLLTIVMYLIFLITIDYSQPYSLFLVYSIISALVMLAIMFYDSIKS
jgi:hypothetical protein